jgi:hypothetical protein
MFAAVAALALLHQLCADADVAHEISTAVPPPAPAWMGVHLRLESPDAQTMLLLNEGPPVHVRDERGESVDRTAWVCDAPCDLWVDAKPEQRFAVGGPNIAESSAFRLDDLSGEQRLSVEPGNQTLHQLGFDGILLGGVSMVVGVNQLFLSQPPSSASDAHLTAGAVFSSVGVALAAASVWVFLETRTHFHLEPSPASATAPDSAAAPRPASGSAITPARTP